MAILLDVHDKTRKKILYKIGRMNFQELQAACIMRGLTFDEAVRFDHGRLATFFIKNFSVKMNRDKLSQFDDWMDLQMKARGYKKNDPIRTYRKFSSLIPDEENPKKKKVQVNTRSLKKTDIPKKEKAKRERNAMGIFSGTKKSYTFDLAAELYEKKGSKYTIKDLYLKFKTQLFERVEKKFPGAQSTSVNIWFKKALKGLHENKGNKAK